MEYTGVSPAVPKLNLTLSSWNYHYNALWQGYQEIVQANVAGKMEQAYQVNKFFNVKFRCDIRVPTPPPWIHSWLNNISFILIYWFFCKYLHRLSSSKVKQRSISWIRSPEVCIFIYIYSSNLGSVWKQNTRLDLSTKCISFRHHTPNKVWFYIPNWPSHKLGPGLTIAIINHCRYARAGCQIATWITHLPGAARRKDPSGENAFISFVEQ